MEEGAASNVVALADFAGVPLVAEQKDLTPLQRMVLLKEGERQMEEAEKDSHGGGGQIPNSHHHPGGGAMSGETVTYVNQSAETN